MDEREVIKDYTSLSKNKPKDLVEPIETINNLKGSITPKQNIQLKSIAVGVSKHEGALRSKTLDFLQKRIKNVQASLSKEANKYNEIVKQADADTKIKTARSIRTRSLRKKFNKTQKIKQPRLSPITEGSLETDSKSPSKTWRTSSSKPKPKKWFFGLF
jgi:hypothetical protein